jgi:hypothetical protein
MPNNKIIISREEFDSYHDSAQSVALFLSHVSNYCYVQTSKYKYPKHKQESQRYRNGQLCGLRYIEDLYIHFFKKERALKKEFVDSLYSQYDTLSTLQESEYKDGIINAIDSLLRQLVNQHEFSTVIDETKKGNKDFFTS